ncbi:MAG: ABC transporter permease [Chloroflexota bacterium]|nr:ABC transporter permease [Chloroflexota bacterium]
MSARLLAFLLRAIASAWLAVTLTFVLLRLLPGDGLTAQLRESGATDSVIAERQAALGLDAPLLVQYGRYVEALLRGDLGVSLLNGQPINSLIGAQVGSTMELAIASLVVGAALGVGIGYVGGQSTLQRYRVSSRAICDGLRSVAGIVGIVALSAPVIWTGTLGVWVFAAQLDWLPAGGAGRLSQLILPALVLGFATAGGIAQVTQRALGAIGREPYVQTAIAKGLSEWAVGIRHVLRVALPLVITQMGIQSGYLLSGAVVTESMFSRPGVGRLLLDAVLRQDYPLVQGIVLWMTLVVICVTALADMLALLADARLRQSTL